MRTSPQPNRRLALALGLVLPLAAAGGAAAEPAGWVDPPASSRAARAPGQAEAAKPAQTASPAQTAAPAQATTPAGGAVRAEAARPEPTRAAVPPKAVERREAASRPETPASRPSRAEDRRGSGAVAASQRHVRPGRRLADTPAAGPGSGPAAGHADAARALAAQYLAAVSGPGEALVGAAPRFYGARVRFYGRPTTMAALIAEKRDFARRWPERRYEARVFRTACAPDGETCTVRALVEFRAASPARGAVSRGASELVLEVSFAGGRPVIVAETGRVLRRGGEARAALAPTGDRA